ncbi:quercetin 2,3-dioxygenase [Neobacillus vireti]|uniref:quercetin 2,3-dioxygenase n=1 Tax=Neobacillus vireti TaxID=220686 RepID=UPI002FFF820C
MSTLFKNKLPDYKMPYMLKNGEGERYLFGRQLATIIANSMSTDHLVEMVILSGGKGDSFPLHKHLHSHEGIYVLHGRLEVVIADKKYLLTEGNYAYIPAGISHSYQMLSHRTQVLSFTSKGNVSKLYSIIGEPYEKFVHPPKAIQEPMIEKYKKASLSADIEFILDTEIPGSSQLVENGEVPEDLAPYVLETGEGIRLVTGDQLHTLMTTQANSKGEFIFVVSEGPKGEAIPEHYHEKHTEIFFCIEGQVTLWANGEELTLHPGDILHVPANTVHSYRMDSHYTKMIGILATGLFEAFFRTLGDIYDDYIFPSEPAPLRFDRVIQNLDTLDLKVLGGAPSKN